MMHLIRYQGDWRTASIIPQARHDGTHYEVNLKGYPRFYLKWVASGRYDLSDSHQPSIPDELVLLVGDEVEERFGTPSESSV